MNKYFVYEDIYDGVMQFEANNEKEVKIKSQNMCPLHTVRYFRAYKVKDFESKIPVNKFVSAKELKELGH